MFDFRKFKDGVLVGVQGTILGIYSGINLTFSWRGVHTTSMAAGYKSHQFVNLSLDTRGGPQRTLVGNIGPFGFGIAVPVRRSKVQAWIKAEDEKIMSQVAKILGVSVSELYGTDDVVKSTPMLPAAPDGTAN